MPDLRRYLRGGKSSARTAAEEPGKSAFRLLSKAVFVVLVLMLLAYSVATDVLLLAVLASLAVGIMLRAVLPTDRFKSWVRSLWSGDAGESLYQKSRRRLK